MKKLIINLILFIFILNIQQGYSYTLTYKQLSEHINKIISQEAKQNFEKYNAEIKTKINGIPNASVITNENIAPKIEIISTNSNFQTNSLKRVVIKDSKNNIVKSFPINVQTLVYKDVLVASDLITFNGEINQTNTTIEKREISKYLGKTYSDYVQNLNANRNFPKGSVILSGYIKEKPVVLKNSTIDIIFKSDKGLKITLQGKALKDGSIGDIILVKSDKYNKTYNAKVSAKNEVTVRI